MTDEIDIMRKSIMNYDQAIRIKKLNEELYEHLTGSIYYLMKYAEKNNLPLPKKNELLQMVEKADFIIDQFAKTHTRRFLTGRSSDEDFTEPY